MAGLMGDVDPGTQENGMAGSSTGASLMNSMLNRRTGGANPAIEGAQSAAKSYRSLGGGAAGGSDPLEKRRATANYQSGATQEQRIRLEEAAAANAKAQADAAAAKQASTSFGSWSGGGGNLPSGSNDWLNTMSNDIRASQAQTMNDQMRALQAQMAGRQGMLNSGGSAAAIADLYRKGGTDMQAQLSKGMFGAAENERDRALKAWSQEGDWQMQREGNQNAAEAAMNAYNSAMSAGANQNEWEQQKFQQQLDWEKQRYGSDMNWDQQQYNRNMDWEQNKFGQQFGLQDWQTRDASARDWYNSGNQFDIQQGQLDKSYYDTQMDMMRFLMSQGGGMGADVGSWGGGPGYEKPLVPTGTNP